MVHKQVNHARARRWRKKPHPVSSVRDGPKKAVPSSATVAQPIAVSRAPQTQVLDVISVSSWMEDMGLRVLRQLMDILVYGIMARLTVNRSATMMKKSPRPHVQPQRWQRFANATFKTHRQPRQLYGRGHDVKRSLTKNASRVVQQPKKGHRGQGQKISRMKGSTLRARSI